MSFYRRSKTDIPKLKILKDCLLIDTYDEVNGKRVPRVYPVFPDKVTGRFFSIWNLWPHLRGRSVVIGLIGGRGSGKTANSVRMLVMDYLLKGRRVWSRLPVAVDLTTPKGLVPLRNIEITPDFKFSDTHNGVIFLDEVNEEGADSYRSMSTLAMELSYDLQELRKGGNAGLSNMDLIWTTQSEMFNMPRLRYQTDIIIKCFDLSISKPQVGMGEYTRFEIWDYSGILKGKSEASKMTQAPVLYNKPWWHCYNTGTKQREAIREQKQEAEQELIKIAAEMSEYICRGDECGTEKHILWKKWGIPDNRTRAMLGKILAEQFSITPNYNAKRYKFNEELANV